LHGVISAKSALMKVIAIPENQDDVKFSIADKKLKNLTQILDLKFE